MRVYHFDLEQYKRLLEDDRASAQTISRETLTQSREFNSIELYQGERESDARLVIKPLMEDLKNGKKATPVQVSSGWMQAGTTAHYSINTEALKTLKREFEKRQPELERLEAVRKQQTPNRY
jgi:hypothetical protein